MRCFLTHQGTVFSYSLVLSCLLGSKATAGARWKKIELSGMPVIWIQVISLLLSLFVILGRKILPLFGYQFHQLQNDDLEEFNSHFFQSKSKYKFFTDLLYLKKLICNFCIPFHKIYVFVFL